MPARLQPSAAVLAVLLIAVISCAETATIRLEGTARATALPPTATLSAPLPALACPDYEAAPVPEAFQPVYDDLRPRLEDRLDALPAVDELPRSETHFGVELTVANGNRGNALLQPSTMPAVRLYLDRFQALGVTGVSIQVSDPLLTATDFDNFAYLEFFRSVVGEAHARGLRVLAETGPVFTDPGYSNVKIDWSQYSMEEYFEKRRLQLVLVAREIKPDYLSLGNEPETEKMLTGLDFSAEEYHRFLVTTVAEIGPQEGLLLGGGTGSWEDPAFRDAFLNTEGLQFLNIHVYPIAAPKADLLERLIESARMAKDAGRKVIVGESWLYKATPQELEAGISYQEVYARDAFRFWEPLDILFLQVLMRIARSEGFEYLSFFWSGYFFGYLEYDDAAAALSPADAVQNLNQTQFRNLQSGSLSGTGCAFREALLSSR